VFDHVTIRAGDREASERFYETVLPMVALTPPHRGEEFTEWGDFSLAQSGPDRPPTHGLHVAFGAPTRRHVDAFWRAGVEAGYRDDGAPGPRVYMPDYYGAFLLDPDGNSAEAVHHGALRLDGAVDHLWIRVADVSTAQAFYETVAAAAGFYLIGVRADAAQFAGMRGSFSVVAGPPSEHVHLAFPATADAVVDAFHRAATAAGYPDNGPPAERPYHTGYYAAYVLDPDGNNVEVVSHNRPRRS
jgi:catechol 2,3-dioxygenase-like lactoylglutathione lyase family enzyme